MPYTRTLALDDGLTAPLGQKANDTVLLTLPEWADRVVLYASADGVAEFIPDAPPSAPPAVGFPVAGGAAFTNDYAAPESQRVGVLFKADGEVRVCAVRTKPVLVRLV